MNHLLRSLAPITDEGWEDIDTEARERLTPALAARKLVDFSGPVGWQHSATNLGRVGPRSQSPIEGVHASQRRVLPLAELRADFTLSRSELADGDRGADDVDYAALDQAAHQLAVAENHAVFQGLGELITGIAQATPHAPLPFGESAKSGGAKAVAAAVETLLQNGVGGPYGLAVGPAEYRTITGTAEHGGYPLYDHIKEILDGPIIWSPGLTGGIVLSMRGGDFVFDSGQDISVGYAFHDAESVQLYLEESFSFHVATPEAAVVLSA